jgi:hypothetical protein
VEQAFLPLDSVLFTQALTRAAMLGYNPSQRFETFQSKQMGRSQAPPRCVAKRGGSMKELRSLNSLRTRERRIALSRIILGCCFSINFLVFLATDLCGQESTVSAIVGQITDQSQAGVPGATVRVINVDTNAERVTTSGAQGEFSTPNLPPARYKITIEKTGFATTVLEPFDLRVGETARRTIALQVGAVNQTVEVTAEAPLMQTESGTVGQVITGKQIEELPLNGRNLVQLATLSAGVSPRQSLQRGGTQYGTRNEYVQVEGGRDGSTNYVIDGVYIRSLRFNNLSIQPSVDTIQEFNVLRNSFSSEYGQGRAVVTAVTKSGTNSLHGTMYEFLRNDALDARNFFAAVKPAYRQNQFGATAGAPVIKDKFFVFGGYEGLRTTQGQPFLGSVPNPQFLTGNFSSLPASQWPKDPSTGVAFPNGIIPAARISQFANTLTPTIPAPNNAGSNNYLVNKNFLNNYNTVTFRADQVLSQRHSLFERYIWHDASQTAPATFSATNFPQSGQNVSVGDTFLITPKLVNELRLGYNRAYHLDAPINFGSPDTNWVQKAGLTNLAGGTDAIDLGRPNFAISGYSGQGEGTITQGATENIYSLSDGISDVFGRHTLQAGAQLQNRRFFQITEVPPRGQFTFNGQFTGVSGNSIASIADYLLGYCSSCQGALGSSRSDYTDNTASFYVNDVFQVNSRLTVTMGLRYEYISTFKEQANQEGAFDPSIGKIAYHVVPQNIPPALAPLIVNQNGYYPSGIIKPDLNNWAPRVGIAYRPTDKLVIRSGFGVFFDNNNLNELQFTRLVAPFYVQYTYQPPPGSPVSANTLFPSLNQVTSLPAPFSVDPANATPYVTEWNFSVQQSFHRNYLLEVAYTGSEGHKFAKRWNQNAATSFSGTTLLSSRIPFPAYQPGMLTSSNMGKSNFHGLSVRLEKRYSAGLYFLSSFQWSKNIDNGSGEVEANDTAFVTNFNLDRGLSRYDQRARAVESVGYELPFGKGKQWLGNGGFAAALLGNWQLQGLVTLLSGFHNTPTGTNVCNCGSYVPQRVNPTGTSWQLANPTPNLWFNPLAFALPPNGFQGTAGRNVILGPGFQTFDISGIKNFVPSEHFRIQFRAEFFNILNHPNFGFPDANITNNTKGTISSAYDGRDIQFGLKVIW